MKMDLSSFSRSSTLSKIQHRHDVQSLISFEKTVQELWEAGDLPYLVHLSGGNEEELLSISEYFRQGDWFFSNHRNHYHYLLSGGSEAELLKAISSGRSMFTYGDEGHNFLTSSILAGCTSIACGVAWRLKEMGSSNFVWCFLGDGAEEQGNFYESVLFAASHRLNCYFIIEDNDRSVDTPKSERTKDLRMNWPEPYVFRYKYTPTYPHAGSGTSRHIIFNRDKKPGFC